MWVMVTAWPGVSGEIGGADGDAVGSCGVDDGGGTGEAVALGSGGTVNVGLGLGAIVGAGALALHAARATADATNMVMKPRPRLDRWVKLIRTAIPMEPSYPTPKRLAAK